MKKMILSLLLSLTTQSALQALSFQDAASLHLSNVGTVWGIASNAQGVYVSDWENDRVVRYDASGQAVAVIGQSGSDLGQFSGPKGMALDENGRLYVADAGNSRVEVFAADGSPVAAWTDPTAGLTTDFTPEDVKLGSAGQVYVSDSENHRIVIFDRQGQFLGSWGHLAFSGPDGFAWPEGLAVDTAGNVYVTDSGNGRVLCYTATGTFIRQIGARGVTQGTFDSPMGVVVLADGTTFVADNGGQRVQAFDSAGNFEFWWGQYQNGAYFQDLYALAQAADGSVLVADGMSGNVYDLTWTGLAPNNSPLGGRIENNRADVKAAPAYSGPMAIGPVPAAPGQELCLALASSPARGDWKVYSIDGRLVASTHFDSKNPQCWNGSGSLPKGVYLVQLTEVWDEGDRQERIQKIVLR